VNRWGSFEHSDIERNDIDVWDGTTPNYVRKSERELERKPGLAPDVCYFLDYSFDADRSMQANDTFKLISDVSCREAYFGCLKEATTEGGLQEIAFEIEPHDELPSRKAGKSEVLHLAYIAGCDWQQSWNGERGNKLKEPIMSVIFFGYIVNSSVITTQMYVLTSLPVFITIYRVQRKHFLALQTYHEMFKC